MGTSFYERGHLSSPSFDSTSDQHENELQQNRSLKLSHENRQRRSYPVTQKRDRTPKVGETCESSLKDSLLRFLADSQHEDLQFRKANIHDRILGDDGVRNISRIDDKNDSRGKRSSKKSRSKTGKNSIKTDSKRNGSSRRKRNDKPKNKRNDERRREKERETSSSNDRASKQLALHSSLSDLDSKIQSTNLTGSLRSQSLTSGRLKSRVRDRSSLMAGLESLDRQVRRDRMKKEYRNRSVDLRGGESFSSGLSHRSQQTARSYRKSGLEGGALNAYMGNDHIVRQASRGGDIMSLSESASSFFSIPATEEYLRERKARQDHILDLARTEKRLQEVKVAEEAKRYKKKEDIESILHFSDDETEKKTDVLVDKMKRVASKTAKIPKSSVKEAAIIANSKLASNKSYNTLSKDEKKLEKTKDGSGPVTNQSVKENKGSKVAVYAKGVFDRRSLKKKRSERLGREKREDDSRIVPNSPRPRTKKKKKKRSSGSSSNSPKTGHRKKKNGSGSASPSNSPRIRDIKDPESRSVFDNSKRRERPYNSPKIGDKKDLESRFVSDSSRNGDRFSPSPRIRRRKGFESRLISDIPKPGDRFVENQKNSDFTKVQPKTSDDISQCSSFSEISFPVLTDPFSSKVASDWWDI